MRPPGSYTLYELFELLLHTFLWKDPDRSLSILIVTIKRSGIVSVLTHPARSQVCKEQYCDLPWLFYEGRSLAGPAVNRQNTIPNRGASAVWRQRRHTCQLGDGGPCDVEGPIGGFTRPFYHDSVIEESIGVKNIARTQC